MFFFKLLIAAAMIQMLRAQENGPEYINIVAGENPLTFVHPELPAGINDVIVWSFVTGGNHSVIQSTYENPCHYLPGGFYSGFQSVPPRPEGGAGTGPVQFLVTINTTDPIYYFCGQIGHCQGGMVGVINPPCNGNGINSMGSFNVYKSLAMAVTSIGPLPSVIMGGQLVSTGYPSGRPTGSPGPYYTGFSASCTAGSNSSSNSSESTITSAATSTATSATSSGLHSTSSLSSGSVSSKESTTSSGLYSISSLSSGSVSSGSATSSGLYSASSLSSGIVSSKGSTTSSANTSAATYTTSSGSKPISSSGAGSIYDDISLRHQGLLGLIWQAGSRFGLVIAILFAFIIL